MHVTTKAKIEPGTRSVKINKTMTTEEVMEMTRGYRTYDKDISGEAENIKVITRLPYEKDLGEDRVSDLCNLINRVYGEAESDMWQPSTQRISLASLKMMLKNKMLLIAELEGKTVGCVNINLFDDHTAKFGMLAANPDYRGMGIGRELVNAAEKWALENGRSIMRLELLTPKDWKHPSKEFLKNWYTRIGYILQHTEPFEKLHLDKIDKLATPCDFSVYHKQLITSQTKT